jgi:hypothetical protein
MKRIFVIILVLFTNLLFSTIINIPADQPTIQAGIDVAVDGDTVLVQPGTYIENINYNGKNITVSSLFLTTQDTIYISQTIIDGDSIDSVVIFESGEDSTAVLLGFAITNGLASGTYPANSGGGVNCFEASPTLSDLHIINNYAHYGGGISCYTNSSPIIKSVLISNNTAVARGGGIWCGFDSSPNLEDIIIDNNYANLSKGGGIFIGYDSSPIFNTISVINNHSGFRGGGVYCCYNSNPIFNNAIISDNTAEMEGGGISVWNEGLIQLTNSIISGNSSEYFDAGKGGGCEIVASSSAILKNVVISNNISDFGGGIYFFGSNYSYLILENVTITENTALTGGGIYGSRAALDLTNCIMWNNTLEEVYFNEENDPSSITIAYSDIEGGEAGIVTNNNGNVYWLEGNIGEDPLFVGTGDDPFSLLEDSPCIDAGIPDTTGLNLPPWDIIGNLRIWDGDGNGSAIIDMGAYEYGAPPYVDVDDNIVIQTPEVFLHQNYPNPFNPVTTIEYSIPQESKVELKIYNIKGQKVKTLVNELLPAGEHSAIWNGRDSNNKRVGSGIYLYRLQTGSEEQTKKMLLLK